MDTDAPDTDCFNPHQIDWTEAKVGRLWNYYGASAAHATTYFGERVGAHFVRVIKRMGVLRNASSIVDFSCGNGAIVEALLRVAPSSATVTGLDPSEKSILTANKRNAGFRSFSGAIQFTRLPTPLPDEEADVVILTEVVEHLDEGALRAVLGECWRILRAGGKFVVTTPNDEDLEREKTMCPECGCIFHRWQHQRKWTVESLGRTLQGSGFSIVKTAQIAWGNELIDLAFTMTRRKKTGIVAVTRK